MDFETFKAHFPEKISKALVNYVTNTVLKNSRYLFYKTAAGVQTVYCTHCNKRHISKVKLKHKQEEKARCPHCKSECHVRSAGMGRKYMTDDAVLVWYDKSLVNPNAIVARIMAVRRDYSQAFQNVKTEYYCDHMYLFEPGASYLYQLGQRWLKCSSVFSAFDKRYAYYHIDRRFMSVANIRQVVKGTPFQYSTWDQYTRYDNQDYVSDMVEFFELASRYPCVEYLTKSGFGHLVRRKLHGDNTKGAIHWRGETIFKVLRLTKQELKEIARRKLQSYINFSKLLFLQRYRRNGGKRDVEDVLHLHDLNEYLMSPFRHDRYQELLKYMSSERLEAYLFKQLNRNNGLLYSSITTVFGDYYDYICECNILGMDLKQDRYLFPNCLRSAHQSTSAKVKLKNNKEIEAKIQVRFRNELSHMTMSDKGYIIRPAASQHELFAESKALGHCVGSFSKRYADGEANIFFVRRESWPDRPLYTCEIDPTTWTVIQVRKRKNRNPPKLIVDMVNQFAARMKKEAKAAKNKLVKGVAV